MDYLTIKEAAEKWGISGRMVTYYCVDGRIEGVIRKANVWLIPADAKKPADNRCIAHKNSGKRNKWGG